MGTPKDWSDFPKYPNKVLRDFEHTVDTGRNTVERMGDISGKELQESYRAGLPKKVRQYTGKVTDH